MDNLQPSSLAAYIADSSAQSKSQAAQKTVAQLLDDKDAIKDWVANIDRIRRLESVEELKRSS